MFMIKIGKQIVCAYEKIVLLALTFYAIAIIITIIIFIAMCISAKKVSMENG